MLLPRPLLHLALGSLFFLLPACTSSSDADDGKECEDGEEGCACFANDTCNDDLSCLSHVCVDPDAENGDAQASSSRDDDEDGGATPSSANGDGGRDDSKDPSKPGAGGGDGGEGATDSDGDAPSQDASVSDPGSNPDEGETGSTQATNSEDEGDAATTDTSEPDTTEDPEVTDPEPTETDGTDGTDEPVTDPEPTTTTDPVPPSGWQNCPLNPNGCEIDTTTRCDVNATANWIDDFATCDTSICSLGARVGKWFAFAGDGIGLDADQRGVMVPPAEWSDPNCGMLLAGGPKETGTEYYAGVGFALNDGDAYDLSGSSGVGFVLGSGQALHFSLRTASDEYFEYPTAVGPSDTLETFVLPFSGFAPRSDNPDAVLSLSQIVELQWTVDHPEDGFGFVLHGVWLDE